MKHRSLQIGTSALALLAGMTSFAMPVYADSTVEITSPGVNAPCQLISEITITGIATASAPPGQLQQYAVQLDWGDGTVTNDINAGLFGDGQGDSGPVPFSVAHTYTTPGNYLVKSRIYHQTPPGNDNQADSVDEITVCVVSPLAITKTAQTSYARNWSWTVDKTADQSSLLLSDGQLFPVNYNVAVNGSSQHSGWMVSGSISVTNPVGNPDVTVSSITDQLSMDGSVTVNCPADMVLSPGESLECTYSQAISGANNQINTATVTTNIPVLDGSTMADVTFGSPTTITDECVTVTDTASMSALGTVCGTDVLPVNYGYQLQVGKNTTAQVPLVCGPNTYTNTATATTNDTATAISDAVNLDATVACGGGGGNGSGCTLTQGYWKTHNDSFKGGAPTDDTWNLIVAAKEQSAFYLSGMSWFGTFWTAVQGNSYFQLAHQYMAAQLNSLNGASVPAPVQTAMNSAQVLLLTMTPAQVNALKASSAVRKQFVTLAGILGNYNEGNAGVPHCSE